MDSFEEYLSECYDVEVTGNPGALDLHSVADRDSLNFVLLDITDRTQQPREVWEHIEAMLADAGYVIPEDVFTESDGEIIVGLNAPGGDSDPCALYFAYTDEDIFAEIVSEDELEEITNE